MYNKYPNSNLHELNLDYILDEVKRTGNLVDGIDKRIDEVNQNIDRVNENLDFVNSKVNGLSTEVADLSEQFEQTSAEVTMFETRVNGLESRVNNLDDYVVNKFDEVEGEFTQYNDKLERLSEDVTDTMNSIDDLQSQIDNINLEVEDIKDLAEYTRRLIDTAKQDIVNGWTEPGNYVINKKYNTSGVLVDGNNYRTSDLVALEDNTQYYFKEPQAQFYEEQFYTYFDEHKNFISKAKQNSQWVTPPEGARYVAFSYNTTNWNNKPYNDVYIKSKRDGVETTIFTMVDPTHYNGLISLQNQIDELKS